MNKYRHQLFQFSDWTLRVKQTLFESDALEFIMGSGEAKQDIDQVYITSTRRQDIKARPFYKERKLFEAIKQSSFFGGVVLKGWSWR